MSRPVPDQDSTDAAEALGELVSQRRQRYGLTMREAAREAKVSFSTISRIEHGVAPSFQNCIRLLRWLGHMGACMTSSSSSDTHIPADAICSCGHNDDPQHPKPCVYATHSPADAEREVPLECDDRFYRFWRETFGRDATYDDGYYEQGFWRKGWESCERASEERVAVDHSDCVDVTDLEAKVGEVAELRVTLAGRNKVIQQMADVLESLLDEHPAACVCPPCTAMFAGLAALDAGAPAQTGELG